METFVNVEGWRSAALLINLITFFLAFSAFSVGLLISARIKRLMGDRMLGAVVTNFLVAAGALALRSLAIILFHLGLVGRLVAVAISDLALMGVAGGLFAAYLVFERFLKTKEAV